MDHMGSLVYLFIFLQMYTHVSSEIRHSIIVNKLTKVKPALPGPYKPLDPLKVPTRHPKAAAPEKPSHHAKAQPSKPGEGKAAARHNVAIHHTRAPSRLANIKPVGEHRSFVPLTEIPPPKTPQRLAEHLAEDQRSGRRHLEDCSPEPDWHQVAGGPEVHIAGEYYDDHYEATARTVKIPMHIDHLHYDVTQPERYFTLGTIEGIGYHPTTEVPNSCEKIYQEHLFDQYSEESADVSEESLEVARMPLFPPGNPGEQDDYDIYSDMFKK